MNKECSCSEKEISEKEQIRVLEEEIISLRACKAKVENYESIIVDLVVENRENRKDNEKVLDILCDIGEKLRKANKKLEILKYFFAENLSDKQLKELKEKANYPDVDEFLNDIDECMQARKIGE